MMWGTWCAFVCGVVKGLVRAPKGDSVRRALGCNLGLLVMLVRVACARVCDVSKAQADFFPGTNGSGGAAFIFGASHFC